MTLEFRIPEFLSPSALAKFESERELFYVRYLSLIRTPRAAQEAHMAMGSGFDARVKSAIHVAIYGEEATKGTPYELQTIFENQVEPHIRDTVWERSLDLFNQYVECGAYGNLLGDIAQSEYEPDMEFEARGTIEGVPLLGKPDLRYVDKSGLHVIADWKVNGSMSKTGASPAKGYKLCLDYGSRTNGKSYVAQRRKTDPEDKVYKDYTPFDFRGLEINKYYLEEFDSDWADQLSIYSWLLGEPVGGEDFVIRMEQVACRPVKDRVFPRAKFATHMSRVSKSHQEALLARIKMCWATIQSGHIFTDLSKEDSDAQCEMLDGKGKVPVGVHPVLDDYRDDSMRFK